MLPQKETTQQFPQLLIQTVLKNCGPNKCRRHQSVAVNSWEAHNIDRIGKNTEITIQGYGYMMESDCEIARKKTL